MELSSFTSFIEIGATLTIAFVAVEYTKQYTCLIAQKVFDYFGRIKNIVLECKKTIDEDTIDGLSSFTIDGCNTGVKIEGLKRKKEITLQDIDDKEKALNAYVMEKCNSKSYSSLSLFIFLFSLTSLFIAGIETPDVKCFWILVVFFSLLYTVTSWILGEKSKHRFWIDYSSFKTVLYIFFAILLLSLIATYLWGEVFKINLLPYCYDIIGYITLFLPYVNFVVFAFIIRSKSVDIYSEIDKTFEPLKKNCSEIQKETEKLSTAKDLALEIKGTLKTSNLDSDIKANTPAPYKPYRRNSNKDSKRRNS